MLTLTLICVNIGVKLPAVTAEPAVITLTMLIHLCITEVC